jgi:septum formation protein
VSVAPVPPLVLASTSPYRRALLARLRLDFECIAPDVDESRQPAEAPLELARRLARLKAESVATARSDAVVIGSDQVAVLDDDVLGKPGTAENCIEQLHRSSGREVVFLTAVHVVCGATRRAESHVDRTMVRFRALGDGEIRRYVATENPVDCAGGFKAKSLGISLFDRIESEDPTGLTGLPLIWLCAALRHAGIPVP